MRSSSRQTAVLSHGSVEEPSAAPYPITFIALAIGMVASKGGQQFVHTIVEHNPGIWLISGVPVAIIAIVVVITIVLELLGGVIFDFDVRVYRRIFTRLDEMVREMEELGA